ncbi:hypothetical protein NC796_00935 [Aliifodinibius sp. S!AR15-10]|uniref:hypothetical protein n=1 Tax=Aliifodinibius sp. S!AR15-10 TaxID=2950437 RepID=UPI002864A8DB|nr:hypothetical protein [Aliifodinibius sp. S!AR15-10]MDR8389680.1 hypothetical protein [Aliifodinibius sp. S!AR15-10]
MNNEKILVFIVVLVGLIPFRTEQISAQDSNLSNSDAIQPYHENPWYWEYHGEPILLRGGSDDDNLFQWTGDRLINHLDSLESVGGNYVRNTMSDRDEGSVYAPKEIEDGMYDLNQWNEEYWDRLEFFLEETQKRGIIVQLTLWDWFDLSGLSDHPYNPENNINWPEGTIEDREDFYGGSIYENKKAVLEYQRRFIDKLLSITLDYDHILYNINNESTIGAEWENYWAKYLNDAASSQDRNIHITSMQLLPGNSVRHVMTNRDLYSFVEVSQNNQNAAGTVGYKHYENLLHWRNMINAQQEGPMPMNNVKVYGVGVGENTAAGTEQEAIERFWRNIFAGSASARFHRPGGGRWGLGLTEKAQRTITAASMFLDEFDVFNAKPYEGCETIGNSIRADYCLANVGKEYAVYFPDGRSTVAVDPWVYMEEVTVKWLNLTSGEWEKEETIALDWKEVPWVGPDRVLVISPGSGVGGPEDGYGNGDAFIGIIEAK